LPGEVLFAHASTEGSGVFVFYRDEATKVVKKQFYPIEKSSQKFAKEERALSANQAKELERIEASRATNQGIVNGGSLNGNGIDTINAVHNLNALDEKVKRINSDTTLQQADFRDRYKLGKPHKPVTADDGFLSLDRPATVTGKSATESRVSN
jgi:hypothetical protein